MRDEWSWENLNSKLVDGKILSSFSDPICVRTGRRGGWCLSFQVLAQCLRPPQAQIGQLIPGAQLLCFTNEKSGLLGRQLHHALTWRRVRACLEKVATFLIFCIFCCDVAVFERFLVPKMLLLLLILHFGVHGCLGRLEAWWRQVRSGGLRVGCLVLHCIKVINLDRSMLLHSQSWRIRRVEPRALFWVDQTGIFAKGSLGLKLRDLARRRCLLESPFSPLSLHHPAFRLRRLVPNGSILPDLQFLEARRRLFILISCDGWISLRSILLFKLSSKINELTAALVHEAHLVSHVVSIPSTLKVLLALEVELLQGLREAQLVRCGYFILIFANCLSSICPRRCRCCSGLLKIHH